MKKQPCLRQCLLLAASLALWAGCLADEPKANVTFTDSRRFIGYCSGYVPGGSLVGCKETKQFWVAVFWLPEKRALFVFDMPKPTKSEAWSRRVIDTCRLVDVTTDEPSAITKIPGVQPVPLMSEVEVRNSDKQRTRAVIGFDAGNSFLIPKKVEAVRLEYKDTEEVDADQSLQISLRDPH